MSGLPPLSCEVAVWHPDARQVLGRGSGLPVLDFAPGADPAGVVRAAWGLPVWPLHDLGVRLGTGGLVQFQGEEETAPAGLVWSPVLPETVAGARPWQRPGGPARTRGWTPSWRRAGRPAAAPPPSSPCTTLIRCGRCR